MLTVFKSVKPNIKIISNFKHFKITTKQNLSFSFSVLCLNSILIQNLKELTNTQLLKGQRKPQKETQNSEIVKKRDTPSEAFEPSHFEAAVSHTWKYHKCDETMTWKSIYHNHATVKFLYLKLPKKLSKGKESVKSLIRTLPFSPLMDAPISSFLPEEEEKKKNKK